MCIGYLDGTDFNLAETPTLDPVSYFSRKQRYAVKAQVTNKFIRTDIYLTILVLT